MSAEYTVGRKRSTDVSPTLAPRGSHVDSVRLNDPRVSTKLTVLPTPRAAAEPNTSREVAFSFRAMLERYPRLNAEQEVLLFQARKAGKSVEDLRKEFQDEASTLRNSVEPEHAEAFERVLADSPTIDHIVANCNLRLAAAMAGRWKNDTVDYEDRTSAAYSGLLRAAGLFDVTKGNKFSTFATHQIYKAIQTEVNNVGRLIRLPADTEAALARARQVAETLRDALGREPTKDEWREAILSGTSIREINAKDAIELLQTEQSDILSLDVPMQESDSLETFGSFVEDPTQDTHAAAANSITNQTLHAEISGLSEEERNVVLLHFGFGDEGVLSYSAIGKRMGKTPQRINTIQRNALAHLRQSGML
jgi:RNA polymerase sigma factor (sigma-70 family)